MEINIIWIEDDKDWQEGQEKELREEIPDFELHVKHTKCGDNIESLLKNPVDFVLCDWRLKENNNNLAIDLVKRIRKNNRYCRIVFYSGFLDEIKKEQLFRLIRSNICRLVDREDLKDVVKEEIKSGLTIVAIIDKWLTYYGKDKEKFTFSVLGEEFRNKNIKRLVSEVRKGSPLGQKFTYEITKCMLSMIVD